MQGVKILFQRGHGLRAVIPVCHGLRQFFRDGIVLQQLGNGGFTQQNIRQTDMRHFDFVFHIRISQR